MTRAATIALLLTAVLSACGGDAMPSEDLSDSPVPWITDLAAGRAEAAKTGKPMFVVFRCNP